MLLAAVTGAALLSNACVGGPSGPSDSSPDQAQPGTTSTDFPPGLTAAEVTRVVDGDTIEVEVDGQEYKVRYIGIDTPESVDPRRPVGCFGKEAADKNRELVEGKTVGLEKDVSETDAFGRLLRYVWLDGRLVNARLVSEGYALAATYPPDVRYSDLFAQLEDTARKSELGLWGRICETAAPSPAVGLPSGHGGCDFSGTSEGVIKGNISIGAGEKIYHVPGGEYYDATAISENAGERWFCTETEAVSAGWRRSLR